MSAVFSCASSITASATSRVEMGSSSPSPSVLLSFTTPASWRTDMTAFANSSPSGVGVCSARDCRSSTSIPWSSFSASINSSFVVIPVSS